MRFQTFLQILRATGVEMARVIFALENVNVEKLHAIPMGRASLRTKAGVSSRSLERITIQTFIARLRAAHFGAAAFAFRGVASEGWCARRGSNPQPSASETDALSN
jgi:hypothetical protein